MEYYAGIKQKGLMVKRVLYNMNSMITKKKLYTWEKRYKYVYHSNFSYQKIINNLRTNTE